MTRYLKILLLLGLMSEIVSCKKFVDVDAPASMITSSTTFNNDATASAVMNGLYSEMMNSGSYYSSGYISLLTSLSADEAYHYSSTAFEEFTSNGITQNVHGTIDISFWQPAYKHIYTTNLILENLAKPNSLSEAVKKKLEGEARLVRAFIYFELVNLFGKVPLIIETNYHNTSLQARKNEADIYASIESDLLKSIDLLGVDFISNERVKPTKHAARALLSRVYLYQKNYSKAIEYSTQVINTTTFSLSADVNDVFKKNSSEAIWQLKPVNSLYNTWESSIIVPATASSSPTFIIASGLLSGFEPSDKRKAGWTKSRTFSNQTLTYSYKYKTAGQNAPLTEYYMILRLAEQYLIRAEARAMTNDLDGAKSDLNLIKARAGLGPTTAASQSELLSAIEQERRVELFCEWGHRWFDLKRTNRANAVLSVLKANWQATDMLWPIPNAELKANPNLDQNPGY